MILMNFFGLEEASLDFIDTIRFICIELSKPEVALGCLHTVVAIYGFDDSYVEAVALLTVRELS